MKRKPMLFQKLDKNLNRGRAVIGLIGTHRGVGVTHTALMLAFYMGEELGLRSALLECNSHHDLELIQEIYEWNCRENLSYSFHKISCHKEVTPGRIADLLGEDYECLILDFGVDFDTNKEEFLRCSTKIIIGGSSEWDLPKLKRFITASQDLRGSKTWLYFIPQASDRQATRISNEIQRKVWSVPHMEEPTIPSNTSCRFFSRFF